LRHPGGNEDEVSHATRQRILAFLREHNTMTLATECEGEPYAADLFYANDGFTLYFVSEPSTQHARNIASNPRVAVTIHAHHADWRTIQGLQLRGRCELIAGAMDSARAMAIFAARYPLLGDLTRAPQVIAEALAKVRVYRVIPDWARWIDNTRGFGYKEEIYLEDRPRG